MYFDLILVSLPIFVLSFYLAYKQLKKVYFFKNGDIYDAIIVAYEKVYLWDEYKSIRYKLVVQFNDGNTVVKVPLFNKKRNYLNSIQII